MNWLLLITLYTGTAEESDKTSVALEPSAESAAEQQHEPDIELLLFLAEWDDSDNDQWLDPEIFASEDSMNQQLDRQKAKQNETDPDHN